MSGVEVKDPFMSGVEVVVAWHDRVGLVRAGVAGVWQGCSRGIVGCGRG